MIQVAGYKILQKIGEGRSAAVYLALQVALNRTVALKVLNPHLAVKSPYRVQFLRMAKMISNFNHTHVIRIYDVREFDGICYFTMEYLPGPTLQQKIGDKLSFDQMLDIIKGVGHALHYADDHAVVHRNIRPVNILFRQDDTPVLTDFCLLGEVPNTSVYLSPELARGEDATLQSDLYALGMTFYEMLTRGGLPTAGSMMQRGKPAVKLPAETTIFQPILDKLLAHDPKDRFKTAQLLLDALERIMAPIPTLPQEVAISGPKSKSLEILNPLYELPPNYGQNTLHFRKQRPFVNKTVIVGASVLALLIVGLTVVLPLFRVTDIEVPQDQAVVKQTKPPLKPPVAAPKKNEDKIKEEITQLLAQAERQWHKNHLTQPDTDNAYDTYRKILELDANHHKAKQGIQRIADQFEKKAIHSKQAKRWTTSFAFVEQGLKIQPDHVRLQKLSQEIQSHLTKMSNNKIKEQRGDQELMRLLAQAERQLKINHLTQPDENNAYSSYQKVLAMDANNIQAIQGIERIANLFEAKATQRKQGSAWRESLVFVQQGLKIQPEHAGLRQLHTEVTLRLAEASNQNEKRPQAEVASWLEQAERQWKKSFLTFPENDNAYNSYRKVLELDPNNDTATQGIQRIVSYFEAMAEQSKRDGAWKESLTFVDQGLKVAPEHRGLLLLLHEVTQAKKLNDKSAGQESEPDKKEEKVKVFGNF